MAEKKTKEVCPGCGTATVKLGKIYKCPGCGETYSYEAEWEPAVSGKYAEKIITYVPEYYPLYNFLEQERPLFSFILTVSPAERERITTALTQKGLRPKVATVGGQAVYSFDTEDELKRAKDVLKDMGWEVESRLFGTSVLQEIKTVAAAEHPGTDFYGNVVKDTGCTEEPGVGSQESMLRHDGKVYKVPGASTYEYVAAWKGPTSDTTEWKVVESRKNIYMSIPQLKDNSKFFDIVIYEYLPIHAERLRKYAQYVFLYENQGLTIFDKVRGGSHLWTIIKYIPSHIKIEYFVHEDKLLCEICSYPVIGEKTKYVCVICKSLYEQINNKLRRTCLVEVELMRKKEAELVKKPLSMYYAVITGTKTELEDFLAKAKEKVLYAEIDGDKLFVKGSKRELAAFLKEIGLEKEKPEEPPKEVPPPEEKPTEVPPPEEVPVPSPPEKIPPEAGAEKKVIADEGGCMHGFKEEECPLCKRKIAGRKVAVFRSEDVKADIYTEAKHQPASSIGKNIDVDAGAPEPEKESSTLVKQAIKMYGIKRGGKLADTLLHCVCGFSITEDMLETYGYDDICPRCGRQLLEKDKKGKSKDKIAGKDIDTDAGDLTPKTTELWSSKTNDRLASVVDSVNRGLVKKENKLVIDSTSIDKINEAVFNLVKTVYEVSREYPRVVYKEQLYEIDAETWNKFVDVVKKVSESANKDNVYKLLKVLKEVWDSGQSYDASAQINMIFSFIAEPAVKRESLALNPDKLSMVDVNEVNKLAVALGYRPLTPGQIKRILMYATQHEDIKQVDKLVDVESPLASLVLGYFIGRFNR